jgi:orotidine-5'-phosphate decarboxylase
MKIIVALDNVDRDKIIEFTELVYDHVDGFKINHALLDFPKDIIWPQLQEIKSRHKELFIDCKLWDTPNTLKVVLNRMIEKGATMTTINTHNSDTALYAASEYRREIKLLGVTYLTSWTEGDQLAITEQGIKSMWKKAIGRMHYHGFYGMICSPLDLKVVKKLEDEHQYLSGLYPIDIASQRKLSMVCPGITLSPDLPYAGQQRVATPTVAKEEGADCIIIGRGITNSKDPIQTIKDIKERLYSSSPLMYYANKNNLT